MSESLIGQTIDGYRIEEILGRGGMGTVYKAVDVALDKPVALKVMSPHLAEDETFLQRFRGEAKALARIDAPGIVRVLALRETERGVFIVMEYVEGETLDALLRRHAPIPWTQALPLFRQILEAIGHAHMSGVLHRDLKPSNILITDDGQVKVTDFGLAKIQTADADLTSTFETAGTIYYMSPEQIQGLRHVDERSDLFALGMIFYEVLTGRLPVDKTASNYAIQHAIVEEPLPPPTEVNPELPDELSELVMTILEKDPDDRFQDARAVLTALRPLENRAGLSPQRTPSFTMPNRSSENRRRLATATALGLAGLLLLGGAFWAVQYALQLPSSSGASSSDPPSMATLTVTTTPPGASVVIADDSLGAAPVEHSVPQGSVSVRAQMEEFQPTDTTFVLTGDQRMTLDLTPSLAVIAEASEPPPEPENSDASETSSTEPASPTEPADDPPADTTAEASESAAPPTGQLTLTSTPDSASVILDGEVVGTTPLTLEAIREGDHEIAIRKDSYQSYSTTITVPAGSTEQVQASLTQQPAILTVRAIPYGNILIDGSVRADSTGEAVVDTLAPGTYQLTARYQDSRWSKTVILDPGGSEQVTIDFTQTVAVPVTAQTADGEPLPNAEIQVDGDVQGYTPQQLQLRVGRHTITVRKEGYEPAQRTINVDSEPQQTIVFELRGAS